MNQPEMCGVPSPAISLSDHEGPDMVTCWLGRDQILAPHKGAVACP